MGANYDWLARGVQPVNPYAQEGQYLQLQQLQSEQQLRQQQTQQIALQNQQLQQQVQGYQTIQQALQGPPASAAPGAAQQQPQSAPAQDPNSAGAEEMGQAQPQSAPAVQGAPTGSTPTGPGAASPPPAPQAAPSADPYQPAIDKVNGLLQSGQIPLQMGTSYVKTLQEMQTNANTSKAKVAELDKANQDLKDAKQKYDEKEGELAAGALQVARKTGYDPQNGWDPDAVHAALTGVGLMHPNDPDLQAKVANINNQIAQHPDPAQRNALLDQLYIQTGAQKADLEQQKGQQEVSASKATQAQTEANTQKLQREALQLAPIAPADADAQLKAATQGDPTGALYKQYAPQISFYANKGNTPQVQNLIKEANEKAATISGAAATQQVTLPGDIKKAVATEQATTPLKIQQQVATARALRAGDNPAVANVAPAAIQQVQTAAMKADGDYIKAQAMSNDIAKVLDLADTGNKAAGANVPLLGVGAVNAVNGIKRINSAEIAQYGQAGSLLDKIQGKIQGLTEGKPIPKDVLDDMRALHSELSQGSWESYNNTLSSLNQRTGSKFQPTVAPPKLRAGAPKPVPGAVSAALSKVGPGIHKLSDGSSWKKAADGTLTPQ